MPRSKPRQTQRRSAIGAALAIALVAGCGSGDDHPDARAPFSFTNGTYQLTTFALEGDCKADWVASPGSEYVGKIVPVEATTSQFGVALSVCGHDEAAGACTGFETAYDFGMAREGDSLVGTGPHWGVPGCGCTEFDGTATISGEITGDDAARLTWSLTITAPDPECVCSGYHVCSGTIEHRLSQ